MWNISLVALLAFVAILTPVVFFITDISNSSVAGWGDYFRWVGAAAASVIVWEWVERIEALEREEKKDGILGREIFDGDEMLDSAPSEEVIWPRHRYFWSRDGRGGGRGGDGAYTSGQDQLNEQVSSRFLHLRSNGGPGIWGTPSHSHRPLSRVVEATSENQLLPVKPRGIPTPPPAAVSPISRTDTASAASTVYQVRYHTIATPTPPVVQHAPEIAHPVPDVPQQDRPESIGTVLTDLPNEKDILETHRSEEDSELGKVKPGFHIGNLFKRKKALPPAEVRNGQVIDPVSLGTSRQQPLHNYEPWDIKSRLGAFAAEQGEKWREKRIGNQTDVDLPVTIIPAQPRGRTWSPDVPPQEPEITSTFRQPTQVVSGEASGSTENNQEEVQLQFEPASTRGSQNSPNSPGQQPQPPPGFF
jgi:hypothetical protein